MFNLGSRKAPERSGLKSQSSLRSHKSARSLGRKKSIQSIQDSIDNFRQGHPSKNERKGNNPQNQKKFNGLGSIQNDLNRFTQMRASMNTKLNTIMTDPSYDKFFKNGALLKLPTVQQPVIKVIDPGRISFVAQNASHSKESNLGFSRNNFGGFYMH